MAANDAWKRLKRLVEDGDGPAMDPGGAAPSSADAEGFDTLEDDEALPPEGDEEEI